VTLSVWKLVLWMETDWLHQSELKLDSLLEATFLKLWGATLKRCEIFKENGWHSSCKGLVSGFCLQLFPSMPK